MCKRLLIMFFACIIICGCNVKVKYQSGGWGWPGTYVATDGIVDVVYYDCTYDNCCHLKRQVLEALAEKANNDEFSWSRMKDMDFRKQKLKEQCEELKSNQVSRH